MLDTGYVARCKLCGTWLTSRQVVTMYDDRPYVACVQCVGEW